jgi:hypothetical protein
MIRPNPNYCARHNTDICSGLFHLEDALTGLKGLQELFCATTEYTELISCCGRSSPILTMPMTPYAGKYVT